MKTIVANAWQKLCWIRWRRAVIREAKADFSGYSPAEFVRRDARQWVAANEKALRWWFANGATPPEAYQAASKENSYG